MGTFWQDIRYGARMLWKSKSFTFVALIMLALGIGANTAIFSVVHAVLLRPLPFDHPEQLVRVTGDFRQLNLQDAGLSVPELFDFRDRSDSFASISGLFPINANLTEVDQPERVEALLVDVNYFALLGSGAQVGRVFQKEDYNPGIAGVAVISDGLWRRRYGADRGALGKTFRLDNDLYTIVGVMPAGFRHPGHSIQSDVEVWVPAGWTGSPFDNPPRGARMLQGALARLKPGVTVEQAQSRMDNLARALKQEYQNDYPDKAGWSPRVIGLRDDLVGNVRPALLVLLIAVGLVLLIACANVANLMLARASARQHEIAIRRALGAGRIRLIRQLLTESLLLSVLGGVLGLLLAAWGVELLMKLSPANISELGEVGLNPTVLWFTLAMSLLTGVVFGLAPAIQASNPNLHETLKDAARGASAGLHRNRMRSLLVISEFSLALMLLISAALLIRSFWQLQTVDPGFGSENILTARLWLPQPNQPETGPYFKHERRAQLYRQVIERVAALPGVQSVGGVSQLPLDGVQPTNSFTIEGKSSDPTEVRAAQSMLASPGYFNTLGIPLIKGRLFTEQDDEKAQPVAVVNQTLAQRFFPGEDPVGKRIQMRSTRTQAPWVTIIGIVHDVKTEGLDVETKPQVYQTVLQASNLSLALVIRTSSDPGALSEVVRREVRAVDSDLPVFGVRTMEQVMAKTVSQRRFAMVLLGVFASIALALSATGLYGVLAYSVSQRTREIGIRMALGASPGDVLRMVIAQGLILTFAGVAVGLAGAFVVTRFLSSLLFGVSPRDPVTFACITLLLSVVALLACYVPARRATKVDPMIALRYE
ncbi:MAG TPA: ABC transporter permease [Pyrinomonadaceae bacterium]|jgi:putative ABC transport system permease protein